MTEPPAKRAKRTDSSAMWDRNDRQSKGREDRDSQPRESKDATSGRPRREDKERANGRSSRTQRSRSRDRVERRRHRSRSREKDEGRHRNSERRHDNRDGYDKRERERERERNTSRERHRTRRDEPPSRSDRQRTRSRSPASKGTSTRTRSPPRKPRADSHKEFSKSSPNQILNNQIAPTQLISKTPVEPKSTTTVSEPEKRHADPIPATNGVKTKYGEQAEDEDPDVTLMRKMMGFAGFRSTKNTKVPGNDVYAVRKEKKTEYRQYMNRVGGFNRPLSPSR